MSRTVGVLLTVFTVPLTLACMAAGVLALDSGTAVVSRTSSVPVEPAPRVTLFLGSGSTTESVTVRRGDRGSVLLTERDTVRSWTWAAAKPALAGLRASIRGGRGLGVVIEADEEPPTAEGLVLGGPLSSQRDLTVIVPPGSDVRVEGGTLIHLIGLDGPVRASTYVGAIRVEHLRVTAECDLTATRGAIFGSIAMAGGSLWSTVGTGGIRLAVSSPGGTRLHAETASGSIQIPRDYGLTPQRYLSGYSVDGTIVGTGPGGLLRLEASAGIIALS
jgi:hypothetical protein